MSYQTYVIVRFTDDEEDESYDIALNLWLDEDNKCRFPTLKEYDNAIKQKVDFTSWKVYDCSILGQSGKFFTSWSFCILVP